MSCHVVSFRVIFLLYHEVSFRIGADRCCWKEWDYLLIEVQVCFTYFSPVSFGYSENASLFVPFIISSATVTDFCLKQFTEDGCDFM